MTDFLLELRSEEIPARMQAKAREDLARLFTAELDKAGLKAGAIVTYATPRRLALIARDLPLETAAVSEETKGPRTSAPPQALEGFLRKTGLTRDQLEDRDGIWFAVVDKPGRKTAEVLAEAIPAIVRAFPWPKSMRWGAASASTESLRWVRPLQGIVALLGEEVVPFEIAAIAGASAGKVGTGFPSADATIKSSAATLGHRFHHPGTITIGSAADYAEKLRACHVIVDQDERAGLIRDTARELAADAGLELIEDEGLVAENAGLTEWPVPLLGRFDAAFLAVPPEVIQLTARVNQKYFVCRDTAGKLANAFICTANIQAADGGSKIVEGNRKVLAARLADAKFFYETDLKVPLDEQANKLGQIVFHEKLGTVADKVECVAKLARWLVESDIVTPAKAGVSDDGAEQEPREMPASAGMTKEALAALAERAARLAKADLVTGMVGEFPELQGVMGGYYAAAQGEDVAVAEAIRDHYKPVGQGDAVPTAPVTVAVSLADKLDTLVSFFAVNERPTGSKDPFALRRAAIALIQLILSNRIRVPIELLILKQLSLRNEQLRTGGPRTADLFQGSSHQIEPSPGFVVWDDGSVTTSTAGASGPIYHSVDDRTAKKVRETLLAVVGSHEITPDIVDFFADRLKVQQREAGVRHDLIDAVFALGGEDDLVRLLARVKALQAFVGTEDGANLLIGYRRAANIIKKEGWDASTPLPLGEGQGASAPRGEGRGETDADLSSPSHQPSAGGSLPLPKGEGNLGYTPESEEAALIAALDAAAPAAAAAVGREDFEGAMAALAMLRAPIDAFFEHVTVNDADPAKRIARLALLARIRDAVHGVADFSKIEG